MAEETVEYTPSKTVRDFILGDLLIKIIMGPVGSGKSVGCLMAIVRDCQRQAPGKDGIRRSRWAIIRNTNQQLMDTTLKSWFQWFPDGAAGNWMVSNKTFFLKFGDVEAEIMFRPLDTPADLKRLLSLELTSAYFNELREIDKTIFDGVRTRIDRYPAKKDGGATNAVLIGDTNPPDMDSWLYQMMEEPEEDYSSLIGVFKQPGGLDPEAENLENLSDNYYKNMLIGVNQDFIDVHVHGKYGKSNLGKPVHQRFDERLHVRSGIHPEPGVLVVVGMDLGLTPAAVFKQMDGWGRINTLHAVWTEDDHVENFMKFQVMPCLKRYFMQQEILFVIDPSGRSRGARGETVKQVIESFGVSVMYALTNDPVIRINATDVMLTQMAGDMSPAYAVDGKNCGHLVKALRGGYKMVKKRRPEDKRTTPIDKNIYSHVAEANQYGDMFYSSRMSEKHARRIKNSNVPLMNKYVPLDKTVGY